MVISETRPSGILHEAHLIEFEAGQKAGAVNMRRTIPRVCCPLTLRCIRRAPSQRLEYNLPLQERTRYTSGKVEEVDLDEHDWLHYTIRDERGHCTCRLRWVIIVLFPERAAEDQPQHFLVVLCMCGPLTRQRRAQILDVCPSASSPAYLRSVPYRPPCN